MWRRVILQMQKGFLDEHNAYRAEVGRPDFVWNASLAQVSANKTSHCASVMVTATIVVLSASKHASECLLDAGKKGEEYLVTFDLV